MEIKPQPPCTPVICYTYKIKTNMTHEMPPFNGSLEYSPRTTHTGNFDEVTVTIGIRIDLKPVSDGNFGDKS